VLAELALLNQGSASFMKKTDAVVKAWYGRNFLLLCNTDIDLVSSHTEKSSIYLHTEEKQILD
jgi:hypothetical protein